MTRLSNGSKYHNTRTRVDGEAFDSKREAARYRELLLMEQAGYIRELKKQVVFPLIPSQRVNGRVVERKCDYRADFTYYEGDEFVVEDVKGFRTPDYIIKRKLMLWIHGIRIKEV